MVNTFTTTVTQHFQDGQLDLEFDFRTAQLVDSRNLPSKFGQNWVINSWAIAGIDCVGGVWVVLVVGVRVKPNFC